MVGLRLILVSLFYQCQLCFITRFHVLLGKFCIFYPKCTYGVFFLCKMEYHCTIDPVIMYFKGHIDLVRCNRSMFYHGYFYKAF